MVHLSLRQFTFVRLVMLLIWATLRTICLRILPGSLYKENNFRPELRSFWSHKNVFIITLAKVIEHFLEYLFTMFDMKYSVMKNIEHGKKDTRRIYGPICIEHSFRSIYMIAIATHI